MNNQQKHKIKETPNGVTLHTNTGSQWRFAPKPNFDRKNMRQRLLEKEEYEAYLLDKPVTEMSHQELNDHLQLQPGRKIKKRCYCGEYFIPKSLNHRLCDECFKTYKHYTSEMADIEPLEVRAEDIPLTVETL